MSVVMYSVEFLPEAFLEYSDRKNRGFGIKSDLGSILVLSVNQLLMLNEMSALKKIFFVDFFLVNWVHLKSRRQLKCCI